MTTVAERIIDENNLQANKDKNVAKRQGSGQGEIPKSIRFPPNLSLSSDNFGDGTSNILAFTIYEYSGAGYNFANSDGQGRNIFTKSGDPLYFIYLSTPSSQGTSYDHKWNFQGQDALVTEGLNTVTGIYDIFTKSGSMSEKLAATLEQAKGSMNVVAQQLVYENLRKVLSSPAFGATAKRFGGISFSPYQEYLYDSPQPRSKFKFEFRLIPRNPSEIQIINDIIHLFKWASHPSISGVKDASEYINEQLNAVGIDTSKQQGARILSYPNVFGIRYVINDSETGLDDKTTGKDNPWLHKFGPCYCESVIVQYSPGANNYVSYRSSKDYRFASDEGDTINPEGAPIYYDLSITFQEMIILTKETINAGF